MDIIISNAGGVPIYDQITRQMKGLILRGSWRRARPCPPCGCWPRLRISVITTKRRIRGAGAGGVHHHRAGQGAVCGPAESGAGAGGLPPPGGGAPLPGGGHRQGGRRHLAELTDALNILYGDD